MVERGPNGLGGRFSCLPPPCIALVVTVAWWTLDGSSGPRWADAAEIPAAAPGAPSPDADAQRRKAELEQMRLRSEATKVFRLDGAEKTALTLLPVPLMRYSDQPTDILDASLWAYTDARGRPLVLQKIETYARPWRPKWLYAMFSLCDGLVEAQWRDGEHWTAVQPGLELRPIPNAPKPAENPTVRLRQMKDLARRFSVTWYFSATGREEMHLLPKPLHRYEDPDSGIQDGVLVGFTAKGTNPDFALVIELRGKRLADSVWKYAVTRMTNAQLTVRIDEKEVWSLPFIPKNPPAKFETWTYFFEAGQKTRGAGVRESGK